MARDAVSHRAWQPASFILPTYPSFTGEIISSFTVTLLNWMWLLADCVFLHHGVFNLEFDLSSLCLYYTADIGCSGLFLRYEGPQLSQFFVETTGQNIWSRDCLRKGAIIWKRCRYPCVGAKRWQNAEVPVSCASRNTQDICHWRGPGDSSSYHLPNNKCWEFIACKHMHSLL